MKKLISVVMVVSVLGFTQPAFAKGHIENFLTKTRDTVVTGGTAVIGAGALTVHTILHGTKDVVVGALDLGLGLTHGILTAFGLPYNNDKPAPTPEPNN